MIYAVGRSDAIFRMMNTANAQMSVLRNINPNSDMRMLHQMDMQNSLQMEKDRLSYQMLDRLDKLDNKIRKNKLNRR